MKETRTLEFYFPISSVKLFDRVANWGFLGE